MPFEDDKLKYTKITPFQADLYSCCQAHQEEKNNE